MLSEKEVLELGERIMGHVALIEKYQIYAQQVPDQQVRDVLQRHQQALQQHHQTMMGFLQSAQGVGGGMTTPPGQWTNLS